MYWSGMDGIAFFVRLFFKSKIFVLGQFSVAFHAVINLHYPIIPAGNKVKFDTVQLNIGNGYVMLYFLADLHSISSRKSY